jgi:uncharacterized LabA/DUF88 family protein
MTPAKFVAFIDVGFLTAGGARALRFPKGAVRPDAEGVVSWLTGTLGPSLSLPFLRAYWYDGAYPPEHPSAVNQRRYHHAIDSVPGVQLRLGHIAERKSPLRGPVLKALESSATRFGVPAEDLLTEFSSHFTWRPDRTQKGVDTLIVLDLVRLAGRGVCSTALLVAGDRDLAEAVRAAQDFGVRVVIAVPPGQGLADELRRLADEVVTIEEPALRGMLKIRPDAAGALEEGADD